MTNSYYNKLKNHHTRLHWPLCRCYYLFSFKFRSALSTLLELIFPVSHFHFQPNKEHFPPCDPELWPVILSLTYKLELARVKINCHAKYLCQRSFRSKVIMRHTDTQIQLSTSLQHHKVVAKVTHHYIKCHHKNYIWRLYAITTNVRNVHGFPGLERGQSLLSLTDWLNWLIALTFYVPPDTK